MPQWKAKSAAATIPDPFDKSKKHVPTMLTTDLSLRMDPAYEKISRRFYEHPDQFADAFARAWFKLTHRDMGPRVRYLGPLVPKEELIWQDPIPQGESSADREFGYRCAEEEDPRIRLVGFELVSTAWASASTFRGSDKRGGANGARIRLAPQKDWDVNQPAAASDSPAKARSNPKGLQQGQEESLARRSDRAGRLRGVEKAAKKAGHDVKVPFTPGRMDASQEQTDVEFVRAARTGCRWLPQLLPRHVSSCPPRRR